MLILLPPSEGKTAPSSGQPMALDDLTMPQLSGERHTMIGYLATESALAGAAERLGVGKSLEHEVMANQYLQTNPAAPAHKVYSGVLFDAFDYESLSPAAKRRARDKVLIFSALFGITSLTDRIPAYRLPITAKISSVGNLATWWRPKLTPWLDHLAVSSGPIVDCRSGGYMKMWKAPHPLTLAVDVFQMRNGARQVVSHHAKFTRGRIARVLVEADARSTRTLQRVFQVVAEAGKNPTDGHGPWDTELVEPAGTRPGSLQIILPEES